MLWRIWTRARSDEGASAVEFALVWFILALFLVGIIQFGVIFNQWLQMEHAAREGARWAGLRNDAAFVRAQVMASAPALGLNAGDIAINPGDPTGAVPNTPISVSIQHGAPVFTPMMEAIFGADVQMTATATQRVE